MLMRMTRLSSPTTSRTYQEMDETRPMPKLVGNCKASQINKILSRLAKRELRRFFFLLFSSNFRIKGEKKTCCLLWK